MDLSLSLFLSIELNKETRRTHIKFILNIYPLVRREMRFNPCSSDGLLHRAARRRRVDREQLPFHSILIYEPSLTFSRGNCTETARIRPTKPPLCPPPQFPQVPASPTGQGQILASTYKIPSLIFLRKLPSLCSARHPIFFYFAITTLFPLFVRHQLDYRDFTRIYFLFPPPT